MKPLIQNSESKFFAQCLLVSCISISLALNSISKEKPKKTTKFEDGITESAKDGTKFLRQRDKLIITREGQKLTINKIYVSLGPSTDYSVAELYNPTSKNLIIPMSDHTYRLYDLAGVDAGYYLFSFDGGRPGSYGRIIKSRKDWRITGWKNNNMLNVELLAIEGFQQQFFLTADIDVFKIHGDKSAGFRLRMLSEDNSWEQDFDYQDN